MIHWIKSRRDMKTGSLTLLAEMEMAREIFNYWDDKGTGVLSQSEIAE
jgi:hypothetical protein